MPCKNEGNKKLWTCIGDDSAENDVNCTMSVKRMLTDSNASGSTNPRDCIWWAIDLQCERVRSRDNPQNVQFITRIKNLHGPYFISIQQGPPNMRRPNWRN